ncbi:MAG TPA: pyridoxamine 5'-phosphate oxidase family protein [Vicinamibacterales bacterium]|nr:pyridoxamine 5'-phosphate oxidase family protein [Vicinamibacterales bacterium]
MHTEITDELRGFIERQQMFFVATAPLAADGAINVSPKGMDSLRVLGPKQVAYLDLTGSGNETSAHLLDNGRLTMMFCAFEGPPRILRLYGTGDTALPGSAEWEALHPVFTPHSGARQIITLDVERVQTSCGFAVPRFDYVGQRETLTKWSEAKGEDGLRAYRQGKNAQSIDGLPTPLGSRELSPR